MGTTGEADLKTVTFDFQMEDIWRCGDPDCCGTNSHRYFCTNDVYCSSDTILECYREVAFSYGLVGAWSKSEVECKDFLSQCGVTLSFTETL